VYTFEVAPLPRSFKLGSCLSSVKEGSCGRRYFLVTRNVESIHGKRNVFMKFDKVRGHSGSRRGGAEEELLDEDEDDEDERGELWWRGG